MEYPLHAGYNFLQTIRNDIYPSIDPTKSDLSQPGSGRGIGRSVALRYAESGVSCIVLCARSASDLDEVEQSIKKINPHVRVSRLDVLINNAGMTNKWAPIADSDTEMWFKTWDLHIKGTYLMLRAFLPLLVETAKIHSVTGTVHVINTTTITAHFAMPGGSAYHASKFALIRLSEFVVSEYEAQGVNCLSLHPGGVPTGIAKDLGPLVEAAMVDTPDLCAGFAVWLTKGQRAWLNGRYVSATWDVDELLAKKEEIVKDDKLKLRMVV
ncbi:hypothetical protein LTR47_010414 [Exophiala xenobiotica]|nr:hypothetical protein LTR47_010414 [Exophiala xenobiotica]KAK5254778.1 hypothetical protein LTS06_000917 [Exophiala xenobiotica]KAK5282936.1 hypothetical protein LTR40_002542 [Exophiala xenobiotica]KAK5358989.1 hypothetical protein LTS13_010728 [Exophiala xenobiotica]KAK5368910.1 hypothetical protein LTR11_007281 [Exophiala xenobiotica]